MMAPLIPRTACKLLLFLHVAEDTIEISEITILDNNDGDWPDSNYVMGGRVMDGVSRNFDAPSVFFQVHSEIYMHLFQNIC